YSKSDTIPVKILPQKTRPSRQLKATIAIHEPRASATRFCRIALQREYGLSPLSTPFSVLHSQYSILRGAQCAGRPFAVLGVPCVLPAPTGAACILCRGYFAKTRRRLAIRLGRFQWPRQLRCCRERYRQDSERTRQIQYIQPQF